MIPNRVGQRWRSLAVRKLSAFLRGIIWIVQRYKAFYKFIMPSEDNKILELNQYQKSDEAPFNINKDIECAIEYW